jgi:nucleotide-binding universal stress UspA family protein
MKRGAQAMVTIRKVLVATDFSPSSAHTLEYGRTMARALGASLHLLHVLEPIGSLRIKAEVDEVEMERNTRALLKEQLTEDDITQLQAQIHTRWGKPFVEIIRLARTEAMDMIVVGSHGTGPIAHLLLGSVASNVVQQAHCPVLTVRSPEHEFTRP